MIKISIDSLNKLAVFARKHIGVIIPVILAALYVFPFAFNGLLDMPNHITRAYIMKTCFLNSSDPLCSHYIVSFQPSTFFLSDMTLIGFLLLFPPLLAEKYALFFLLASFIFSWYILYLRIHGSVNIGYLAGLSLVLSNYMYNGFYPFVLSITAALLWLYCWWDIKDNKTVFNQIMLCLGMALIFGIHLAGFLFIFMIYCFYEIQKRYSEYSASGKGIFTGFLTSTPLAATFFGLLLAERIMEKGGSFAAKAHAIEFRTVSNKIATFAYPFVNYSLVDVVVILTALTVLIFAIDPSSYRRLLGSFWTKVSFLFFIFFMVSPDRIGGVDDFDARFLPIAYMALFIGVGAFARKKSVYSFVLCMVLLISFGTSLYYKDKTNQQLTKLYDILGHCPVNSSLVAINSIKNYPDNSTSRVSPFPYFGQYHIFRGNSLVGALFDCKHNKNISYFCYAKYDMIAADNFNGINSLDGNAVVKLADYYDYALVTANESEDYIRSKIDDEIFTLIQKNDFIYLFQNKRKEMGLQNQTGAYVPQ